MKCIPMKRGGRSVTAANRVIEIDELELPGKFAGGGKIRRETGGVSLGLSKALDIGGGRDVGQELLDLDNVEAKILQRQQQRNALIGRGVRRAFDGLKWPRLPGDVGNRHSRQAGSNSDARCKSDKNQAAELHDIDRALFLE